MHAYVSGNRRYFIAARARHLVMRNVSSPVPGPVPPFGRGNLSISTTAPAFSAASISSSSVRRCNNLIPYSRGGCRPWRIEWNKIKPRIPRVLWRGSFPTQSRIPASAACARVYISRAFCLLVLVLFLLPYPLFSRQSPLCPAFLRAAWFSTVDVSLVSYISGLLYCWKLIACFCDKRSWKVSK